MKKTILGFLLFTGTSVLAQNTFPPNGYVGIGTLSPVNRLDVAGNISLTNGGNNVLRLLQNVSAGGYTGAGTYADADMGFGSAGKFVWVGKDGNTEIMRLNENGNLGIGTLAPVNLLEAQRDQDAATFMVVRNAASSTSAYAGIRANSQNQTINLIANSDGFSRLYPGFHTSSASILGDAANGLNIISNAGNGTPGVNTGMIRFITYAAAGGVTSTAAGNDAFTRMVINGNGNVGIGTTNPGPYKLAVEGVAAVRKLKVTQVTPWADYVFDPSYELRPLSQVEAFIKTNRHLPDIPSAKEVEKNGIDVGDTQVLLLKKIEELTLYVISLEKKVNELMMKKQNKETKYAHN